MYLDPKFEARIAPDGTVSFKDKPRGKVWKPSEGFHFNALMTAAQAAPHVVN